MNLRMMQNIEFCNNSFIPLFNFKPYLFYNHFLTKDSTEKLLDSMGEHPASHIEFRYDEEKKIRATFIVFDDAMEECEVRCICTTFIGGRVDYHLYFFEIFEDGKVGCIEIGHEIKPARVIRSTGLGDSIDEYFRLICSFTKPVKDNAKVMVHYSNDENAYKLLDIDFDKEPERFIPLLGGAPEMKTAMVDGITYLIYKAKNDERFIVARTSDGKVPEDVKLSDIDVIQKYITAQEEIR